MVKQLLLLGSTGSIGRQTLAVARHFNIAVEGLCANANAALVEQQARAFGVSFCAMADEAAAADLKTRLADTSIQVFAGEAGICELIARSHAPTVLNAIVGLKGLVPTLTAIEAGKEVALANKESLVAGGHLVRTALAHSKTRLLPVDSEHSAIFQCLQERGASKHLRSILLTASGGPFYGKTRAELADVTPERALNHPNWQMGPKITIDSATLMNKGLELIEAMHLFSVSPEQIHIIIQRESIIHSMVEFCDRAVIAQLAVPDMTLPIQYALCYPQREEGLLQALDLERIGTLTFGTPDEETFRCLALARRAAREGGLMGAVLNGANEAAVALFLAGKLPFLAIADRVERAMQSIANRENPTLSQVLEADTAAREAARRN